MTSQAVFELTVTVYSIINQGFKNLEKFMSHVFT